MKVIQVEFQTYLNENINNKFEISQRFVSLHASQFYTYCTWHIRCGLQPCPSFTDTHAHKHINKQIHLPTHSDTHTHTGTHMHTRSTHGHKHTYTNTHKFIHKQTVTHIQTHEYMLYEYNIDLCIFYNIHTYRSKAMQRRPLVSKCDFTFADGCYYFKFA